GEPRRSLFSGRLMRGDTGRVRHYRLDDQLLPLVHRLKVGLRSTLRSLSRSEKTRAPRRAATTRTLAMKVRSSWREQLPLPRGGTQRAGRDLIQTDVRLLLCSHLPLNRTAALERRENLNSRMARKRVNARLRRAMGHRRRRRRSAPSLTSNSLCACRHPCDL